MIGYLRTLAMFYRRHLRVQPLRELMAVGGVAAGVALLFAVQVAHKSVTGSFQELSRGLAGRSTLEVASRGSTGFDAHVAEQIERMSGVRRVAPLLEQPIVAVGPHGRRALTLVGATEQITPLGGGVSSAFERAGEGTQRGLLILTAPVARAIGVKVGSEVRVLVGERSEHLAVDAVVPGSKLGAVVDSPIAAAPLAVVQALAELPGRVSRVLIEVRRGREAAVRKALLRRFGAQLNVRGVSVEAQLLDSAAGPRKASDTPVQRDKSRCGHHPGVQRAAPGERGAPQVHREPHGDRDAGPDDCRLPCVRRPNPRGRRCTARPTSRRSRFGVCLPLHSGLHCGGLRDRRSARRRHADRGEARSSRGEMPS